MLRTLIALSIVAVISTPNGHAQTNPRDSSRLGSLINRHALIRVRGDWGTADLTRPHLVGGQLDYDEARPSARTVIALPRPFPLDTIQHIQVPGNAASTGALVGGLVGLTAGLGISLALTSALCDGGCANESATAEIAIVSTLGGVVIGGVIGSAIRKWRTVYRAGR